MPYLITYYLTPASPTSEAGGDPGFPGSAAQLLCDAEQFDQAHFLSLVSRLLPEGYLRPLQLNPDAGYEIFQAQSAVAARLSTALHEVECGLVMLYAGGPSFATVDVIFYRENAAAGAVTVKAGTLVSTSVGDRQFELTADVALGVGVVEATGTAKAVAPGFEYNVPGQRVTAGGEILPGEIDTISIALQSPNYGDPSIRVRQELDASGGYPDWLAGHGANRGLVQAPGETADAFRARMRSLPDTVTPAAMRRIASRVLDPLGVRWEFVETFSLAYQTCWDAPSPNVGTPTYRATLPTSPAYDPDLFVWDDPRPASPYRGHWLSQDDYTGAFIIAVDRDITLADYGFALDDAGDSYADFAGTDGTQRGTPAYDVTADDSITAAVLDGPDISLDAAIATLFSDLQLAKAVAASAIVDDLHLW